MSERGRASTPSPPVESRALEPDDDDRERKRTRRLVRWTAVIVGIILAVLACWQDPLYAL